MPDIAEQYKTVNLVLSVCIVLGLLMPFFFDASGITQTPRSHRALPTITPPHCVYHQRTGKRCPTCGLTRSIIALYHGDMKRSLEYHRSGCLWVLLMMVELLLRSMPMILSNKVVPWIDMTQLLLAAILFKVITIHYFV